jgi:hypothetical protein
LHTFDTASRQRSNLLFVKVALGLDENVKIAMIGGKLSKELVNVFHIDNVIDQPEPRRIIPVREVGHFTRDLFRRFGAKLHALSIESAKGAMMFLSPPTTARSLVQENAVQSLRRSAKFS